MDIKNVPNLPLYVDCAYMNGNWKYYSMDVHSHGLFECNYIAEGSCVYEIAGREYPLTKRNLILLDSSIPHRIHFNHERPCTVLGFSLSFDAAPGQAAFPPFLQLLNSSLDICLLFSSLEDVRIFPDARSLKPDMLRLYHEYEGRRDNLYLNSLSYHFLAELSRLPMTEKSSAILPRLINPSRLQRQPLSGAHRLHYIPEGGSTAAIFKENLADVPPRRLMHAKPALPLNPSRLQRQPLSGAHRFRFAPAGVSAIRFPSEISLPLQRGA